MKIKFYVLLLLALSAACSSPYPWRARPLPELAFGYKITSQVFHDIENVVVHYAELSKTNCTFTLTFDCGALSTAEGTVLLAFPFDFNSSKAYSEVDLSRKSPDENGRYSFIFTGRIDQVTPGMSTGAVVFHEKSTGPGFNKDGTRYDIMMIRESALEVGFRYSR